MKFDNIIRKIPSLSPKLETENAFNQYNEWFYPFEFTNGANTVVKDNQVNEIHLSRAAMIFPFLDDLYKGRWDSVSCCDIACHEGWFATQIALRGAKNVLGIDVRADHIKKAREIKAISGIPNLLFDQLDLFSLTPKKTGTFTLTLFLGILYHLNNPMDALRVARSITESVCVVETQVLVGSSKLECTWGCSTTKKSGPGIAVLPSDENHFFGKNSLTFVPSIEALYIMLFSVGFSRIYQCIPPKMVHEQYRNNDRIILFAFV